VGTELKMPNSAMNEGCDWWVPPTIARGQRRSERHLTFKTARIVAENHDYSLECVVLNVSQHGACVLVPLGSRIEDRFTLFIDGDDEPHHCFVAWRDGSRIGVSYD
jgi:PilZ domain